MNTDIRMVHESPTVFSCEDGNFVKVVYAIFDVGIYV
jgi:hypothetical protein